MANRVVVVGGGLVGLAAAALCARNGAEVVVIEKASHVGGRAASQVVRGFVFNEGAHALYLGGPAQAVLRGLEVRWTAGPPPLRGALALDRGVRHLLPLGLASFASTSLLPARAKLEAARWVARLPHVDAEALDGISLDEWLERALASPRARDLVRLFVRLTSFHASPSRMSAGAAVRQLRQSKTGVEYVDGGWQSLVDGVCHAAETSGVRIVTAAAAVRIGRGAGVTGVRLEDGAVFAADAVIVAAAPRTLDRLLGHAVPIASRWASDLRPVRVACLDVALRHLPDPKSLFALGFDAPTYFSVHSASACLTPEGGALACAMKYLGDGSADGAREELEAVVDVMQPGWRQALVHARMLPLMVVSHATLDAATNRTLGRPSVQVPGVDGLYVAGDWVGHVGMLLDAGLASARSAAAMAAPEARCAAAG